MSVTRAPGQGVEPLESSAGLSPQPQLERGREVRTVGDKLVFQIGSLPSKYGDVMVAVKIKMRPQGSLEAFIDKINEIEAAFKQRFPQTQWTFFEPDVRSANSQ